MNHAICHVHWDREWFAPSRVTNKWLKILFNNLFNVVEQNEHYVYVLDGQTLILEDVIKEIPDFEEKLKELTQKGNLLVGPFYTQIDFRLSSEPAILKNLEIGMYDKEVFKSSCNVAWAVDNFGFISQLPQILNIFDIRDIFLWRGVNLEKPALEFLWKSREGSQLRCIFLLGGYRNIYGLNRTPDLAIERFNHEVEKLKPYSRSGEIPLLDGYDLDLSPEDPSRIGVELVLSNPGKMIDKAFSNLSDQSAIPVIEGELLSGKYACTFPGTLSTRTYLKRQAYVVGKFINYLEFLEHINSKDFLRSEALYREYLKTLIHDNICGVGIDKVHFAMSRKYKTLYFKSKKMLREEIGEILCKSGLKKGIYALSFSPYNYDIWYSNGKTCYKLKSEGVGLYKIDKFDKSVNDNSLVFKNKYYTAEFLKGGSLKINDIVTGILVLQREHGDAYSTYTTDTSFNISLKQIRVEKAGNNHKVVLIERLVRSKGISIRTFERVVFDESPFVKWQLRATFLGKNYKLIFATHTYNKDAKVFAKMPFEIVERRRKEEIEHVNDDLKLKKVLLAAREEGIIKEFPFQGFVAISDTKTTAVMARGLHEYQVSDEGLIGVTLVRSVEWIAKREVKGRNGDAGPLMLVPGAKCEGSTDFELGICYIDETVFSPEFFKWFTLFDNPPIGVSLFSNTGTSDSITLYSNQLPWVSTKSKKLVVYNPFSEKHEGLEPHKIGFVLVDRLKEFGKYPLEFVKFRLVDITPFPEFKHHKSFRQNIKDVERLSKLIKEEESKIKKLEKKFKGVLRGSNQHYNVNHKLLTEKRTLLELRISRSLIKSKVPETLMYKLNILRSQKRIYDYVIELKNSEKEVRIK